MTVITISQSGTDPSQGCIPLASLQHGRGCDDMAETRAGNLGAVHTKFNAADADVVFQSPDGVQFRVHRRNLEIVTGAFPGSEFDTCGEITHLTEPARVLAVIFDFIYPRRYPDLKDLPFETLAEVAEAVEKYEVFSAMPTCETRLREFIPQRSLEILGHALKHGYSSLVAEAVPHICRLPLSTVMEKLPLHYLPAWVHYYEAWSSIFAYARHSLRGDNGFQSCQKIVLGSPLVSSCCQACRAACVAYITSLQELNTLSALKDALSFTFNPFPSGQQYFHCGNCNGTWGRTDGIYLCYHFVTVSNSIKKGIDTIPPFDYFLKGNSWGQTS
ncbi:unnamed protein product [Cyclocybe aegerita]|uniref:BTB domain-containing protein n=1 Tax=Cyclocybe aegerita TaxID=1973307 RepID=A0A8S0WRW1_CYCAE|nr:unnamed protein product [Cyclocybe aegerita]